MFCVRFFSLFTCPLDHFNCKHNIIFNFHVNPIFSQSWPPSNISHLTTYLNMLHWLFSPLLIYKTSQELHQILSPKNLKTVIFTFITSPLDFCNPLLSSAMKKNLSDNILIVVNLYHDLRPLESMSRKNSPSGLLLLLPHCRTRMRARCRQRCIHI